MKAPSTESPAGTPAWERGRAIGTAALILMLGNLTTSALGFVRQATISHTFGSNAGTDAFVAASVVPQMFYDLTIGAAVSAALIPTLTAVFEGQGKGAVARTSGAVLGIAWAVLAVVVVGLMLAAHPLMSILLWAGRNHLHPGELSQSVTLVRVLLPSLFFLGTSAVLLATLYSIRRFTVPAFATAFFHLGIIGGAVLLARPLGIVALPIGALVGAALQALVQVPELIRAGIRPRIKLELAPELRSILKLYAPV
ncbi:MAG TPA: lipid II flippase MurJ, partial [Chloroflexota bacterium]